MQRGSVSADRRVQRADQIVVPGFHSACKDLINVITQNQTLDSYRMTWTVRFCWTDFGLLGLKTSSSWELNIQICAYCIQLHPCDELIMA